MKIKIQTEHRGTQEAWDNLARKYKDAAKSATGIALHAIEREAKINATVNPKVRTGRLRQSILVRGPRNEGFRFSGEVGPTVIYGRIQELGGEIFPKRAKWLHWVDGTGDHFAKHVTLPSRPYLKPAVSLTKGMIGDIFRAELAKASSS